jgi:hypothetical protein
METKLILFDNNKTYQNQFYTFKINSKDSKCRIKHNLAKSNHMIGLDRTWLNIDSSR